MLLSTSNKQEKEVNAPFAGQLNLRLLQIENMHALILGQQSG